MPKATTKTTIQRARDAFLGKLAAGYSVTAAAAETTFGREWFYGQRKGDEVFCAAWDDAIEAGSDLMEDEARRRAVEGVEEPIVAMGRIAKDDGGNILTKRVYSDSLLLASLKRRRPEAWGVQKVEATHSGSVSLTVASDDAAL